MGRKASKRRSQAAEAGLAAKRPGRADGSGSSDGSEPLADPWRPWLLAGAVALLVARPLYPSESPAETGDGLPIVMLWLALAVVWMLGLLGRAKFHLRFGLLDGLVVFLVLWQGGAALVGALHSQARPAVTMLWEWVGLGLIFLLVRQWVGGTKEIRTIVVVMLGVAVALAGYGLFQCVYEFPKTRALYRADPERALQEAGFYYPPGSPERIAFEKRLESREPIATFALTNSLAGFLTPWLVAAAGIGLFAGGWSAGWRPRGGLLVGGLLVGACLLLTKSRSAYLANLLALGGLAVIWLWGRMHRACQPAPPKQPPVPEEPVCSCSRVAPAAPSPKQSMVPEESTADLSAGAPVDLSKQQPPEKKTFWRQPVLGCAGLVAAVVLMIVAAFYTGGLDIQVLTEAKKSLQYRWEYWQATWQIIRREPIWGSGPGLFRYAYTRFKLPQASEEIADPHHFLLEVWATGGTPAALALLGFLVLWAIQVVRVHRPGTVHLTPRPEGPFQGVSVGQGSSSARPAQEPVSPSPDSPKPEQAPQKGAPQSLPQSGTRKPTKKAQQDRPVFPLLGAGVGVAVGFWVGQWSSAPPSVYFLLVGVPLGLASLWAFWPWVHRADGSAGRTCAGPGSPNFSAALASPAGRETPDWGKDSGKEVLSGVLALAGVALLVNLLAAGGISFAGVAGSFWLLAALATGSPNRVASSSGGTGGLSEAKPSSESPAQSGPPGSPHAQAERPGSRGVGAWLGWLDRQHQVGWPGAAGGLVWTMGLFFACHQSAFSPVLQCQATLRQALRTSQTDPVRAEKLFQQAALADPLSSEPIEWLSALAFQKWKTTFQQRPTQPDAWLPHLHQLEQYASLALQLNPEDGPAWFVQAERFLFIGKQILEQHGRGSFPAQVPPQSLPMEHPPRQVEEQSSPAHSLPSGGETKPKPTGHASGGSLAPNEPLRQALRAFRRALGYFQEAVSLYPNHALYRARLAETFALLGYQPGMIREAQAALWLDDQMPHVEKKLPEPLRRQLARMQAGFTIPLREILP